MKKFLLVLTVGFVLVMSLGLKKVTAGGDDDEGVKVLAGKYSSTAHASYALCLDPTNNFAEINCADTKAKVFPETEVDVGNGTQDASGNSCTTYTGTISDQPPDVTPPVVAVFQVVSKDTSFDPAAGAGDGTYTGYAGGKCVGADFDSNGATKVVSGGFHFVISDHRERVDFILTSNTDQIGGRGDFSYSGTNLRQ